MAEDLEERLKSHAEAFEGLMSLIPANQYYNESKSDHWQGKKHTKEQKRLAKSAKLDPVNHKSAMDILNENERKRKRELNGETVEDSDLDTGVKEQPGEGRVSSSSKIHKKPKLDSSPKAVVNDMSQRKMRDDKRKEKARQKREKKAKKAEKKEAKRLGGRQEANEEKDVENLAESEEVRQLDVGVDNKEHQSESNEFSSFDKEHQPEPNEILSVDVSGLLGPATTDSPATVTPSSPASPESQASVHPSASSSSSIVPLAAADTDQPKKIPKFSEADQEALKTRLHERIQALRAARKADGIDGKPARSRQELLEARRRKEEQRKAQKKEQRAKAKEEEQRQAAEAETARLRGSGSPLTPDIFTPRGGQEWNNFSFGTIAFDDGQQLDTSMSALIDPTKKKGPQDVKSALEAAEKKKARINGLDSNKKADIEEKDMWLSAKKRAHGEKVMDNTSLLKKALKRKEKAKQKSEKEWSERAEGIRKGQEAKQKRREANLNKRKEEKGSKGKSKGKSKGNKTGKTAKGRPGFEGSFRAKPR